MRKSIYCSGCYEENVITLNLEDLKKREKISEKDLDKVVKIFEALESISPSKSDEGFIKRIGAVSKNSEKSAIEKKIEIFDILLEKDFGDLSASEKERANILLKSHFYGELAKTYLKEYKKETAKEFSND